VTAYLLDTHTLLWWVADDRRITDSLRATISTAERVIASDVSLWELTIKSSIGKLRLTPDAGRWFRQHTEASRFGELSIARKHVERVESLPLHHRDPFDRLLIAQAIEEDLTVVTADAVFGAYPVTCHW
jgi:PIN domain nuclease of toxin-antitoxin system